MLDAMATQTSEASIEIPLLEVIRESMMDAVYLIDPESSNIIWVNRAGYEDLQMEQKEVLHHSVLSLQKDVHCHEHWLKIADVIRQNKKFTFIGSHIRKDGSELPVEVNTSLIKHQGKEYFLSVARDISARRAIEAETQERSEQIWFAVNACTDGLWDWEINSDHVYFSPQLKKMVGYGPEEMQPFVDTWKNNVHPEDLPMVLQSLEEHIQGKRERYEATYRMSNRNGHYIWVHDLGCISLRSSCGKPIRVTGMVKDITDYKQLEFKLLELAAYDELTKLRNRREFKRIFDIQLDFAERHQNPLSLCLFDFDYFKTINDQYGHLAGDYVLKEISRILVNNIRSTDFLFRWGGEEFALIFANTRLNEAEDIAEELRQLLSQQVLNYAEHQIKITGSFGVASYPDYGKNQSELFLAADSALYQAKSRGRNLVCSPQSEIKPEED